MKMSRCGWASIDERGRAHGGRAGDQTGKEVKVGGWYYFGQTQVVRWEDRSKASLFANCIKSMCLNALIGYDQSDRTTLYTALKKVGWNANRISTKVECDCSELVVCGVNCTFGKALLSSALYTGNLASGLMATGHFKLYTGSKYCKSDSYLKKGDIIIKPYGHVIVALDDGALAGQKSPTTGKRAVAEPVLYKGCTGSQVKKLQGNLNAVGARAHGERLELDGSFGALTKEAVKNFQRAEKITVDGSYGKQTYKHMLKRLG